MMIFIQLLYVFMDVLVFGFQVLCLLMSELIFGLLLMNGDRLVNAATGTGKTVAYLAPVIHQLQKCDPRIQRSDGTFGTCRICSSWFCMLSVSLDF